MQKLLFIEFVINVTGPTALQGVCISGSPSAFPDQTRPVPVQQLPIPCQQGQDRAEPGRIEAVKNLLQKDIIWYGWQGLAMTMTEPVSLSLPDDCVSASAGNMACF